MEILYFGYFYNTLVFKYLSNLANDYGDGVKGTDNEDRIGPERAIQSGKISPEEMFNAIKINILNLYYFAFCLYLFSFGVETFFISYYFFCFRNCLVFIAALNILLVNNAYGYRGLGDVFVFIFFGLVSVIGCYVLYAKQLDHVAIFTSHVQLVY